MAYSPPPPSLPSLPLPLSPTIEEVRTIETMAHDIVKDKVQDIDRLHFYYTAFQQHTLATAMVILRLENVSRDKFCVVYNDMYRTWGGLDLDTIILQCQLIQLQL